MVGKEQYIYGLDILRFAAIIFLVWGHCLQSSFADIYSDAVVSYLPSACLTVLFVMSGFLAGYKTDTITNDIIGYYKKRFIRLFPIYYLYIALTIICYCIAGNNNEVLNQVLLYYLVPAGVIPFCADSIDAILPFVHLWFISVIALFYLIQPIVCKYTSTNTIRSLSIISLTLFIVKTASYLFFTKNSFIYRFLAASQFDCIFCGMLFGVLYRNRASSFAGVCANKFILFFSWVLFLASGIYDRFIPAPVRNEIFAIISTFLIICLNSWVSNGSHIRKLWSTLSNLSYDLYVIHIAIIIFAADFVKSFGLVLTGWPEIILFCTIITLIAIPLSYILNKYIESPLKTRLIS